MKHLLAFLLGTTTAVGAYPQYWEAVGQGTTGMGTSEVRCLYNDTVADRLLAGGIFFKIINGADTVWAFSQAAWNGDRWDTLGTGLQPTGGGGVFAPEVYWYLRFEGSLYACGNFLTSTPAGMNMNFARLNEQTGHWEALACINAPSSGLLTLVPKEPQSVLYATGFIGGVCGIYPPSCIFSYDGNTFQRWEPFDQLPEVPLAHVSYVFDYRDKTYMIGVFPGPAGQGVASFLRYNGSDWELVPGWNNLMASIWDYSIHNDTLYVAGDFLTDDGGPGNLVASFDGEQWNDMGGGLHCDACWSANSVNDLEWFHGELWACGMFDHVMNMPAHSIAKWNGHGWCVPPGEFIQTSLVPSKLYDMAVWRDSLYVCGLINTVDGDTMKQVLRWIGGDAVAECSTPTAIAELPSGTNALQVVPLPSEAQWTLHFPRLDSWTIEVYDALGKRVSGSRANSTTLVLDLTNEAPGIYLLRAVATTGERNSAKVLRP